MNATVIIDLDRPFGPAEAADLLAECGGAAMALACLAAAHDHLHAAERLLLARAGWRWWRRREVRRIAREGCRECLRRVGLVCEVARACEG